jgi:multidrug efflux pump subunit AcrA (membrane-fusion protein)
LVFDAGANSEAGCGTRSSDGSGGLASSRAVRPLQSVESVAIEASQRAQRINERSLLGGQEHASGAALVILASMSSPLTSAAPVMGQPAWQELEDVFAGLGQLARSSAPPEDFYRQLLEQCVRSLSAVGGAAWLRAGDGSLRIVAQCRWPAAQIGADAPGRRAHEKFLSDAASGGCVVSAPPAAAGGEEPPGNPTDCTLLVAPIQVRREVAESNDDANERGFESALRISKSGRGPSATLAILEILQRPDSSPGAQRGYEQFLTAVAELAADYHIFRELRELRRNAAYREQLLCLSRQVHCDLNLSETAYAVANDGRRVIACDRLSVLLSGGGRSARLLATSGTLRVERRGETPRRLEELAGLVARTNEPAYYADAQCDALPPIAEALERHAEATHARQIMAVPLRSPHELQRGEPGSGAEDSPRPPIAAVRFVLIAEQFDARDGDLQRERLVETAEVVGSALANALEVDRLPLAWLLRPMGAARQRLAARWPRWAVALAGGAAAALALILVPANFHVEAPGTLQPVVRHELFAPRSGLVDAVLVEHGAAVAAGQPLVRLRDPALELEINRVHGEIETAQRQIDAVRAMKTSRVAGSGGSGSGTGRPAAPIDMYRLSADERELDQRLANLRRELDLLHDERASLVVNSPIAGRVLTWDVANRLVTRPVERGEVLATVADLSADWRLELDVPDNRIGHVLAAQQALGPDLPVRFRLSSDDREQHLGRVAEICRTADVDADGGAPPAPVVRINVSFDASEFDAAARGELRPGVSARAQIACGRRPVGYVWLHDIWDAVIGWLRF